MHYSRADGVTNKHQHIGLFRGGLRLHRLHCSSCWVRLHYTRVMCFAYMRQDFASIFTVRARQYYDVRGMAIWDIGIDTSTSLHLAMLQIPFICNEPGVIGTEGQATQLAFQNRSC